jgi:EAL domain-containing protein (putative c-di-GMP-specific phosphodiesterase class I)
MNAQYRELQQPMVNPAVLAEVLEYLNQREFSRDRNIETLFIRHDHVRAHYASFELDSLFQPVFDFKRRRVIGHEALLASVSGGGVSMVGNVLTPERVFTLAANEDITFIDRLARTLHSLNYLLQGAKGFLHLNVHPHHLLAVSADHGRVFEGILRQCGLETRNIVLEIPEYAVAEKKRLADAVNAWQQKGYHIAIDNVGREQAQISRIRKLKPDYIKIDRILINAALGDSRQRRVLARVVQTAMEDNISVIATGIETHAQLDLLHELNVDSAQGFLFGKPQPYCLSV